MDCYSCRRSRRSLTFEGLFPFLPLRSAHNFSVIPSIHVQNNYYLNTACRQVSSDSASLEVAYHHTCPMVSLSIAD